MVDIYHELFLIIFGNNIAGTAPQFSIVRALCRSVSILLKLVVATLALWVCLHMPKTLKSFVCSLLEEMPIVPVLDGKYIAGIEEACEANASVSEIELSNLPAMIHDSEQPSEDRQTRFIPTDDIRLECEANRKAQSCNNVTYHSQPISTELIQTDATATEIANSARTTANAVLHPLGTESSSLGSVASLTMIAQGLPESLSEGSTSEKQIYAVRDGLDSENVPQFSSADPLDFLCSGDELDQQEHEELNSFDSLDVIYSPTLPGAEQDLDESTDEEFEGFNEFSSMPKKKSSYSVPLLDEAEALHKLANQREREAEQLRNRAHCVNFLAHNRRYHTYSSTGLARLDLHLLPVHEALVFMRLHLDRCRKRGVDLTEIITGRGLHSWDGKPKIKPMVLEELKRHTDLKYKKLNPGCVGIKFMHDKTMVDPDD